MASEIQMDLFTSLLHHKFTLFGAQQQITNRYFLKIRPINTIFVATKA